MVVFSDGFFGLVIGGGWMVVGGWFENGWGRGCVIHSVCADGSVDDEAGAPDGRRLVL